MGHLASSRIKRLALRARFRSGDSALCPAADLSVSALLGALVGGGASLLGAMYTQRSQDRLQRVASEIAKRQTVYADFVMRASNLLLNAYTRDEIAMSSA